MVTATTNKIYVNVFSNFFEDEKTNAKFSNKGKKKLY